MSYTIINKINFKIIKIYNKNKLIDKINKINLIINKCKLD